MNQPTVLNETLAQAQAILAIEIVLGLFVLFLFIITCLAIVSIKSSIRQFVDYYYAANQKKIQGGE
jgi:hypothetical protein